MRLSRSIVGSEEADAVASVILHDGYLGMGKEVQAFEEELGKFLEIDKSNIACVNSGTAALHLAVEACLRPGDEVLVQSLTFLGAFQAIKAAGAIPVACDVDEKGLTIDLGDAERRLSKRSAAIMPMHYAGNPGNLDAIFGFAKKHGLRLIEDAAHAFGGSYQGRKIGSFGDICCFSFDGIKSITSGEGGAVVTPDRAVMSRIRDARLLGVERDTERRFAGERSWDFDTTRAGYRYHLSNVLAAIGRVQLRRFPIEFAPKRVQLAERYRDRLRMIPWVGLFDANLGAVIPHLQPIRVANGRRDNLRNRLKDLGIETGIHYKPNHMLTLFRKQGETLPVTERLYPDILSLPLHPGLSLEEVDKVCDSIANEAQR